MSRFTPLFDADAVAEERIQEAMRKGAFDNLPGAGRPLEFDDDLLVPPELRVANRILKNAGCIPPELEERREMAALEASLPALDEEARKRAIAKLAVMRARLGPRRGRPLALNRFYQRKIVEKLAGG
jgi:hypothetical protein